MYRDYQVDVAQVVRRYGYDRGAEVPGGTST